MGGEIDVDEPIEWMLASKEKVETKLSAQLNKLSLSSQFIRPLFLGMAADSSTPPGSPGAGAIGGGAAAPLFPGGLGSFTTPMFIKNIPTKTTTVIPYGNFLDISFKEQKLGLILGGALCGILVLNL